MSNNKNKKLLTLDDLYNFYFVQNKNCTFSSKDSGYKLSVQVPAQFEINAEQNDNSLLFCKAKLMHSGENRNHSSVTDEALTKAAKTLAYKPILANFMEYTDEETGETLKDFTSHDMELNDDGSITYIEKQIGSFTADEPFFEVEEDTGHNFLYGYCAIPREYTDASSIIERKNGTKISVELEINEMQYSVANHVLELTDINILGATCLGKNQYTLNDVEEGMENARLDIADFSAENNSIKFDKDEKIIELLERLNTTLSNFNIQKSLQEGGNNTSMNLFEELLQKYNKTVEDITFEYAELTDEELTKKFEEAFGEETNDDDTDGSDGTNPEPSTGDGEGIEPDDTSNEGTGEDFSTDGTSDKKENSNTDNDTQNQFSTSEDKMVRSFEISHEDIRWGLYNLLDTVSETDNTWYYIVNVFDDYFVYETYDAGKVYGQKYTVEDDNVAFDGERYELFVEYLTESEKVTLTEMRSNYASLVEFKTATEQNELHSQREAILTDSKYSVLATKDEEGKFTNASYADLYSKMDEYSVEDLEKEIKVILGEYALNGGKFSAATEPEQKKTTSVKLFTNPNNTKKKTSRYGNLFNKN
jgi:hypothetical protein